MGNGHVAVKEAVLPFNRFPEVDTAFGKWEGTGISMILYAIDNETHHRAQVHTLLSQLGHDPPVLDLHRVLRPNPS